VHSSSYLYQLIPLKTAFIRARMCKTVCSNKNVINPLLLHLNSRILMLSDQLN
jgi:hypothetical protein